MAFVDPRHNPPIPWGGTPPIMPTGQPQQQQGGLLGWFSNPMTQLGLGLLSTNYGNYGNFNALPAIQMLNQTQARKQNAAYRGLQAEALKQQMAQAKAKAKQQNEMRARYQALLGSPDEDTEGPEDRTGKRPSLTATGLYASDPATAQLLDALGVDRGGDLLAQSALAKMKPAKLPVDIQGYQFAVSQGYKGSFTDWKRENKRAGASKIEVNNNPLRPRVEADLQSKVVAAGSTLPMVDQLIEDIGILPEGVGAIAEQREAVGGIVGQLGDLGIPGMRSLSETVSPSAETEDGRIITPQTIASMTEALTIQLKPLISEKGVLSNQDRLRLEQALGRTASADSERRKEALYTVRDIVTRNAESIKNFLRNSGVNPPSNEPQMPDSWTGNVGDVLDGHRFKGGDPSNPENWEEMQ